MSVVKLRERRDWNVTNQMRNAIVSAILNKHPELSTPEISASIKEMVQTEVYKPYDHLPAITKFKSQVIDNCRFPPTITAITEAYVKNRRIATSTVYFENIS